MASSSARIRFSTSELLKFRRKSCCGIRRNLRRLLFILGLLRHCNLEHHQQLQPIPVRITTRTKERVPELDFRTSRDSNAVTAPTPSTRRILTPIGRSERHSISRRRRRLTFGLLNVRSLHNKTDEVLEIYDDHSLDVLVLTESWHDSDSNCVLTIRNRGFSILDRPRPRSIASAASLATNHGGLIAISSKQVRLSALPISFSPASFEVLCFRVTSRSSSLIFILIYRTGPIYTQFFDELARLLDHFMTFSDPVTVAGDLNIHIERPNDPHACHLLDLLASYGLSCHVHEPTHDGGGTLDHVFSRQDLSVNISDPEISDHRLLSWTSELPTPPLVYSTKSFRPWSRLDLSHFRQMLIDSPLCDPLIWPILDINELANLYVDVITNILDHLIPWKTIRLAQRPSDPWFDEECRVAKRCVRKLERQCQRAASSDDQITLWRAKRRDYRCLVRRKRASYWQSKVQSDHGSPRSLWQTFDALMGRGRPAVPSSVSAEDFLSFFLSKSSCALRESSSAPPPVFPQPSSSCSLTNFQDVSVSCISYHIRRLPNKHSSVDPLPNSVLKKCTDLLSFYISELFNRSVSTGEFPSSWKNAMISPILKKDCSDIHNVSSYRPISQFPVLSKVLERIVSSQIMSFMNDNELLPSVQSAYRQHHSTETAILKVVSDVLLSMDKGNVSLLSFLDLSSAFDCVSHDILLQRLRMSSGFTDTVLEWFSSYLCNRKISVSHLSKTPLVPLLSGVPQGSVLGPILFLVYIADLVSVVHEHDFNVHLFADDILIYRDSPPRSAENLARQMSSCIDHVNQWLHSNRLIVNVNKSNLMWCFSPRLTFPFSSNPICVGDHLVTPVSSVRYLGVILDSHLSFRPNVSKTIASCFSMLRRIRSVRRSLTHSSSVTLISSLAVSRLDYCIAAHFGLPSVTLSRLKRVLHACVRLVFQADRYAHVTPLLAKLGWLPIEERINTRIATLAFQCRVGTAPAYLISELTNVASLSGRRSLRSSATNALVLPRTRRPTFGGRSFAVAAPRVWNSLPSILTDCDNSNYFKCRLRLLLYDNVYKGLEVFD